MHVSFQAEMFHISGMLINVSIRSTCRVHYTYCELDMNYKIKNLHFVLHEQSLPAIIDLLCMSCCVGSLIHINSSQTVCPNEQAVFVCSNQDGVFVNWEMYTREGHIRSFSFNANFHPEGTIMRGTLAFIPFTAEVTSASTSSITTIVTIDVAIRLNGTIITCDRNTVTFDIHCKIILIYRSISYIFVSCPILSIILLSRSSRNTCKIATSTSIKY